MASQDVGIYTLLLRPRAYHTTFIKLTTTYLNKTKAEEEEKRVKCVCFGTTGKLRKGEVIQRRSVFC